MTEREGVAGRLAAMKGMIEEARERFDAHVSQCGVCSGLERGPWCRTGAQRRSAWFSARANRDDYVRRMVRRVAV